MKNFDADQSLKAKLDAFREKVKTGRMVRFWNNRDQLIAAMMQAIVKAISTYPAIGWIRGDAAASEEIMQQYVKLRSAFDELTARHEALIRENAAKVEGLASLNEKFAIEYWYTFNHVRRTGQLERTWAEIFKIVGPDLYSPSVPAKINLNLRKYIHQLHADRTSISVNEMDADTVKIHFAALGLRKLRPQTRRAEELLNLSLSRQKANRNSSM
jgi:hypothetical protein